MIFRTWEEESEAFQTALTVWLTPTVGLLGFCLLVALAGEIEERADLFLNLRYEHFWLDLRSHYLKSEGWKTKQELMREYGITPVLHYLPDPLLCAAQPSEDAALTGLIGHIMHMRERIAAEDPQENLELRLCFSFFALFHFIYLPMFYAVRQIQRFLSMFLCWGPRSRAARQAYFAGFGWRSALWYLPLTFAIAMVLAAVNAHGQLTPAMEQHGITCIELTAGLFWVGCISGLWIRVLSGILDVGFIAWGKNPHHTIWDDVLALAVVAPILLLIFRNSWMTVASGVVVGLASGIVVKRIVRRRGLPRQATGEGSP